MRCCRGWPSAEMTSGRAPRCRHARAGGSREAPRGPAVPHRPAALPRRHPPPRAAPRRVRAEPSRARAACRGSTRRRRSPCRGSSPSSPGATSPGGSSRSRPGSRPTASPGPRGRPWPIPACASSASRWPSWPPGTPYAAVDGCERVTVALRAAPRARRRGRGAGAGRAGPSRDGARQRAPPAAVQPGATWTAAFAGAAVRIRERFGHGRCSAVPLEPRGIVARLGGRSSHRLDRDPDPVRLSRRAGPSLRASGEPRAGDRAGHGRRLRPEDARDARGRRRGRARAGRRPARQVDGDAAREPRGRLPGAGGADGRWRRRPTPNGVLLGLRARLVSDAGAYHIYPLTQALEPLGTCAILPGPYRTPAYAYECLAVATNKPPLGAYRGVGMAFAAFAMERTLDLVADRLGVDPAEIRRRNLIPRDGYPFASAGGFVYDSGDLPRALEQALELSGYERLKQERDAARGHGRLQGVGLACYTEYTGMGSETYRRRGMVEVPGARGGAGGDARRCQRRLLRLLPVAGAGARDHDRPARGRPAGRAAGSRPGPPRGHADLAARDRHLREPGRHRSGRHGPARGRRRAGEGPRAGRVAARGPRGGPRPPRRRRDRPWRPRAPAAGGGAGAARSLAAGGRASPGPRAGPRGHAGVRPAGGRVLGRGSRGRGRGGRRDRPGFGPRLHRGRGLRAHRSIPRSWRARSTAPWRRASARRWARSSSTTGRASS